MRPAAHDDPVHYPESDHVGDHLTQTWILIQLAPLLRSWIRRQNRTAFVGANQFFYWERGNTTKCRAPDVYLIDGLPLDHPDVPVWKTWEGHRPAFVLEVCSDDWQKDYDRAPAAYDAMGAREVVIFDPHVTPRSRRRVRWQVYRRNASDRLVRISSHAERQLHLPNSDNYIAPSERSEFGGSARGRS